MNSPAVQQTPISRPSVGQEQPVQSLEAQGLTKSFGGLTATRNISLHIRNGESLGIIGPNGAGKTTLLNLLTREVHPDQGSVYLKGHCIDALSIHQRVAAGLARTYQVPRPFHGLSVREHIRVGIMPNGLLDMLRHGGDREAEVAIAESVGLGGEQLEKYPHELAMGDLRRLELARTLATAPQVLLLDEVFAGLTVGEIEHISTLLSSRRKTHNTAYMIVSHDLRALEPLVDRVVVIHFGEVMIEGTFGEVVRDRDVQNAYLGTGWEQES